MNARRLARPAAWMLALACFAAPQGVSAQEWDSPSKKSSKKDKDGDSASAKPKMYRFKGEKKANMGGTPVMSIQVEDLFGGRGVSFFVPNNSEGGKDYDPLTTVAATVKELKPGDIVEIGTERQKGRTVATVVNKADIKPGEEMPNAYVFVESDEQKNPRGGTAMFVTLSKFGREVKVGVPMVRGEGSEMKPDPKLDYTIGRMQSGMLVEAHVKSGKPPMLTEIYELRAPERGKFVGFKESEVNEHAAAAFEIKADDGTTITFTLEGRETSRNGKKVLEPNSQQLRMVQKLKPETPVEVRYRLMGRNWMMRDLKVLSDPTASASAKGGRASKSSASGGSAGSDDPNKMKAEEDEKPAKDEKDTAAPADEKNDMKDEGEKKEDGEPKETAAKE